MAMDYSALIEEISEQIISPSDDDSPLVIDVQSRLISIPYDFNKQIAIVNDQIQKLLLLIVQKELKVIIFLRNYKTKKCIVL